MQNKLSKLQRFILLEVYRRGQISNSDILIKWFGFIPSWSGNIKFNRMTIGKKKYKSGSVSVARALTRLRHRGLIRRSHLYGHHELTYDGCQLVGKWRECPTVLKCI